MIGGIWGSLTNALPNSAQAFVELNRGTAAGAASLRILGGDGISVALSLVNGVVAGNYAWFHYITNAPNYPLNPNPATVDYQVTFTDSALWLNGSITSQPYGADIPYSFVHSGVQSVPLPDLFTLLLPPINFGISTNRVFPDDLLGVWWKGYNNATACIDPPCAERFGPAFGPWQDAIFLYNSATNILLGTAGFNGSLPIGGGYTNQASFLIATDTPPGLYGIQVWIDYLPGNTNGAVAEQNEQNNTARLPALLTVLPRLSITGIRRLDDQTVRLQVSGSVTQQVRIQASAILTDGSWADLATFPGFRGAVEWDDSSATNSIRFYRAISP
jgi:hypothetical protein